MTRPLSEPTAEGLEDALRLEQGPSASMPAPPRELAGRLAGLSLPRQVMVLAIWPFLEQVLNFLVSSVDMILAGHLLGEAISVAATNALALAGYVGWLVGMMQMAVGIGATALIARATGARHRNLASAALGQSLTMAAGVGAVMGVVVFFVARPLGVLSNLSGQSLDLCVTYLRVLSPAMPLSAILFVGSAGLRGAGDTRTPFLIMIVVNVTNTLASILFVFGPRPLGGWDVAGIAAGTTLAWAVGAVMMVVVLARGWGGLRLRWFRLRPHMHTMKRIIRIGVPNLFESMGMWIGNFIVLRWVGVIFASGVTAAPGAHMVTIRLESMSFLPGFAMGTAAATLTGQYLGLGDPRRAKRAAELCWIVAVVIMGAMGLLFVLIPHQLVGLMTNKAPLLELSPTLLRICGPVQIFFATFIVLSQAMRGAGDTRTTMLMTYFSTYLVRLPAAYFVGVYLGLGLTGIWLGLAGELALRGCIFAARFLHGGWLKAKV